MKRALLIGINYSNTSNKLNGCVNDIVDIYNMLKNMGYSYFDILIDDITPFRQNRNINRPIRLPTKDNIINYTRQFIDTSISGDTLYIHYSGHGTQKLSSTEKDGYNEAIVPLDYDINGIIIDDELRKLIIEPLLYKNIKLRIIFDCCHSGSSLDLKYNLTLNTSRNTNINTITNTITNTNTNTNIEKEESVFKKIMIGQIQEEMNNYFDKTIVEKNINKMSNTDTFSTLIKKIVNEQLSNELNKLFDKSIVEKYITKQNSYNLYNSGNSGNSCNSGNSVNSGNSCNSDNSDNIELVHWIQSEEKKNIKYQDLTKIRPTNNNKNNNILLDVLMLSGCADNQTSADSYFNNRANGALTKIFIENYQNSMLTNKFDNIALFLYKIRNRLLELQYRQTPQISSEQEFNNSTIFNI